MKDVDPQVLLDAAQKKHRGKNGTVLSDDKTLATSAPQVDEVFFGSDEDDLRRLAYQGGYSEGNVTSSCFAMATFPIKGIRRYTFTPKDVLKALRDFSQSVDMIHICLERYGITYQEFVGTVLRDYPEVGILYGRASDQKAFIFGQAAIEVYEEEIPKEFFEKTAQGKRLTGAGVMYLNNKNKSYMDMAKFAERKRFNKDEAPTVIHIENTIENPDLDDLMKRPLGELGAALK